MNGALRLERPLGEQIRATLSYNYMRQRTTGLFAGLDDIDRSRLTVGLTYRIKERQLGR
jgi:hypothetical protein